MCGGSFLWDAYLPYLDSEPHFKLQKSKSEYIHTYEKEQRDINILRKNIISIWKSIHNYLLRTFSANTIQAPSRGQLPHLGSRSDPLLST